MDLQGKKIAVFGSGRTGLALTKLLLGLKANPFVTDTAQPEKLEKISSEFDALGVPYECGGHTAKAIEDASMIVLSPGVGPNSEILKNARKIGLPIMSEMEFAFRHCRAPIMAVTGTNGKTTTTELLRCLVEACGHSVILAGNNDVPLSAAVMAQPAPDYIVLEVSSYQLETASTFKPWISAVLNLTPDHLARHKSMEDYARVKAKIFAEQNAGDFAVINADDPYVSNMAVPAKAQTLTFSLEQAQENGLWLDGAVIEDGDLQVAALSDTQLPGRHNIENVLAALTMMKAGAFDWSKTLEGLRTFTGVEHRIEFVETIDGVEFWNDSKATNIESLKVALESFEKPIILIAGGEGKGSDYSVLRELIQRSVKEMITLGQDAPLLEDSFGDIIRTQRAKDMNQAVVLAAQAASSGEAVLLSPACASFDMFNSFEERGRVFKQSVISLALIKKGAQAR